MPSEIWMIVGSLTLGSVAGYIHRRIRGRGLTMKEQMKNLGLMSAVLALLLLAAYVFTASGMPY